jgi:dienelactone hydrolase
VKISTCYAKCLACWLFALAGSHDSLNGADARAEVGDLELASYFRVETAKLSALCLNDLTRAEDWALRRDGYRRELLEMLGLWPMPERTPLKAELTGRVTTEWFEVEKVHFQSLPGLYVTANLYLPKGMDGPAPAILYVCGHGASMRDGVSFGNKVSYHHHGAWFARHGYVCLIIDTLQLGEIQGVHHGTYRMGQWWWHSRGYTPAGVETWNGMRAIDYLESRPEVDAARIGMTGRSGGGAYTWFVSALDERIAVSAPVAGLTDLQDHVVDGVVEGHCDCMYFVNAHRWDYPMLAAMVAPRPLLFANSDKDTIFPLDGVIRSHAKVRRVYEALGAADQLGLLITEGPHRDTQDLQVPVFRWFNRFLKNDDRLVETAAVRIFEPEQLKVFAELPEVSLNATIQETFVPAAPSAVVPETLLDWERARDAWLAALREKTFGGWPENPGPLSVRPTLTVARSGVRLRAFEFSSQTGVKLRLFVAQRSGGRKPRRVQFTVLDQSAWLAWEHVMKAAFAEELKALDTDSEGDGHLREGDGPEGADAGRWVQLREWLVTGDTAIVWMAPRGIGRRAWTMREPKWTHIRRRFALLGQTLDGMRVWDVIRGVGATRSVQGLEELPVEVRAAGDMGVNALMAALFEPGVAELELTGLPASFRDGPDYLSVLRIFEIPQAVAIAAERRRVRLREAAAGDWNYAMAVAERFGWERGVELMGPEREGGSSP